MQLPSEDDYKQSEIHYFTYTYTSPYTTELERIINGTDGADVSGDIFMEEIRKDIMLPIQWKQHGG